ncbi:MAG: hypothetical protein JW763_03225 [candidate division Zixibacteria bacterium]|nr:hypothetical protein [candidate division Zixibacteria bacterium]
MKKLLTFGLVGLMLLVFVIGCGQKEEPKTETPEEAPTMVDTTQVMDTTAVTPDTTEVMDEMEEVEGH